MAGPGAYYFGDEERNEVMDVLASGHLSRYGDPADPGFKKKVYTFEQEFAKFCGTKYAVATNSGTASLLIGLLALGIGSGDEVLVPGYTYVASISAIIHARATPVLVEIDESLNMSPEDLKNKITSKTKAILVVHMLGNPADMDSIMRTARENNLEVIEDGCQAAGASYKGKRVGSIGSVGAFSLNRYKNIAAGDGGVVVTNDEEIYKRIFAIHDQGHTPNRIGKDATGSLVGLNFKMNELTGAVALAQIRKLDTMLDALRQRKLKLKKSIGDIPNGTFRTINDIQGECATLLTLIFDNKSTAENFASKIGQKTLINSGWHVYRNMNQITEHKTPTDNWSVGAKFAQPGDLPITDDVLSRSVNISIGVVDNGLGSGFGIDINSDDNAINDVATKIKKVLAG